MKKGIITWILIFAALIATIVLTMPESTFWALDCSKSHHFTRVNCYEEVCIRCGFTQESEYHREDPFEGNVYKHLANCAYEKSCRTCGKILGKVTRHNYVNVPSADCKVVQKCIDCGVTQTSWGTQHTWSEGDCISGVHCICCGKQAPREHQIGTSPIYGVQRCARCNTWYVSFGVSEVVLILVQVLGVALTAFAFQYVIRRRKFMKVHWWLIVVAWLTNICSACEFCPAFLWKKDWKTRLQ